MILNADFTAAGLEQIMKKHRTIVITEADRIRDKRVFALLIESIYTDTNEFIFFVKDPRTLPTELRDKCHGYVNVG
jgi:hypothetical protein